MSAQLDLEPRLRGMIGRDIEAIMRIETDLYEFPWSAGNFRDSLVAGYSAWVAEIGNRLVGYGVLMVAVGEAHVLNVSVARDWHRHGIGRRLMRHFFALARRESCARVLLEVRPSNSAGLALYRELGFAQVGVRRRYYPAREGREDAIVMGLELA